jgi:hypothetical protein
MVKLQSLDLSFCSSVSDLAPLGSLVNLQSLSIGYCDAVSDVALLCQICRQLQAHTYYTWSPVTATAI